jgi:hypothetical protein
MPMLDQDKIDGYVVLVHLWCRVFLVGAFTLAFFIVLGFLLWKPSIYLVVVEAVLTPTTFLMAQFFFPLNRGAKKRSSSKVSTFARFSPAQRPGVSCGELHVPGTTRRDGRRD